nr:MAG TPA: hypothetical protein [Caudoviricetes sp.]
MTLTRNSLLKTFTDNPSQTVMHLFNFSIIVEEMNSM